MSLHPENMLPPSAAGPLAGALDATRDFLTRYIVFPLPAQPVVCALWIAHAHALDAFDFTGYLHTTSPEKRCGKTRLLDCLALLTPRAWVVIQPSEAVLFRKIAADTPTLLLDEVDAIFAGGKCDENREGLRAMLNAGFQRGGKVARCVGPTHEVRDFTVFCAKVIAGIGALPPTVADRSIPILLARKPPGCAVEKFRARDVAPLAAPIREAFETWAADCAVIEALRDARPALPDTLGDRQADICEPLLAIADMAGGSWPADARRAITAIFAATDPGNESVGVLLLSALREIFTAREETKLTTETILDALTARDDGPWAGWWTADIQHNNRRGPAAKLGKLLRPFGIASATIRVGDDTAKGYHADAFTDAWARYLPPPK